jgi:hypothetical protein
MVYILAGHGALRQDEAVPSLRKLSCRRSRQGVSTRVLDQAIQEVSANLLSRGLNIILLVA